MKKVFMFMLVAACLLLSTVSFANGAEPEEEISILVEEIFLEEDGEVSSLEVSTELLEALLQEISVLRTELRELRAAFVVLQTAQPERQISIGVMPIKNAGRISQVGESFRQVLVSALNEAGIKATESLDEETLQWVRRQDQLVREGWLDPISAPRRGELQGVTHFLFATVTQYREECSNEESVGFIVVRHNDGVRVRTGFLSVDFRIVDAASGVIFDAFQVEKEVKERTGPVLFDRSYDSRPISEIACRSIAEQTAERIAASLNLASVSTEQEN